MLILLVEDDQQILYNLKTILLSHKFLVDTALNGEEGLYLAENNNYDLIILDWVLPVMEGPEICQKLREQGNTTPILMLTSKSAIAEKVLGLQNGADDYLTKPFVMEELIARVKALIRRKNGETQSPIIRVGDISINTNQCCTEIEGKKIELTAREYSLLEYLAVNKGKVLSRMEILEHVWGEEVDPFSNTIDVHIRYLRQKIDLPYETNLIKTVKGKGYMLCED